ncbi:MAG TPA: SpoIIE family protein phosphatase [Pseudonocardia sp.]|nr:SpoIIE family protein phosphatase [Pseudonocardia sp.]
MSGRFEHVEEMGESSVSKAMSDLDLRSCVEAFDWSRTPLGSRADWPQSLRSAVEICLSSRFSMWMAWGDELTVLYNDAYRRDTLRTKHPWALGRPAWEVWAEIWPDIGPRIRSVLDTGVATWDERLLLFLERAGYREETYHTFSYSPLRDDHGVVAGMLCVVTEETERVLAERQLRVLRELGDVPTAATAEQACRSAVEVLDAHRDSIPFALAYLREPGGLRLAAATGGLVAGSELATPAVAAGSKRTVWQVAADGRTRLRSGLVGDYPGDIEPSVLGPVVPDEVLLQPIVTVAEIDPVGVLVVGVNPYRALDEVHRGYLELVAGHLSRAVSDARAYADQQHRVEALAELDRAKTEFFTGVSHELRTPLTLIAGPVQDALNDPHEPLGEAQRARLELIRRNSARLRRLIDTLLEFSRLEAGQLRPNLVPVDLAELTRGIAQSFSPAANRAGLELVTDCPPLPSAMLVDPAMWENIVFNLLSNAVKYTPAGTVSLALRADPTGGARLVVSDTGIGIPTEDLQRVFDRFHRVGHGRSAAAGGRGRSIEGTGIGLALVSELAALHGGSATAQSTLGAGSEFTVELPASAATTAPATAVDVSGAESFLDEALRWSHPDEPAIPPTRRGHGPDATAAGASNTGPTGSRVLVVEDNPDLRGFVASLLEPHYNVVVAGDGHTGLRLARTQPFDLVLTDVMMPGLDGFELLTALRADPATAGLPVILLSARAGQEAVSEGLEAGADDYLVKPFSSADLVARVRSNMELARLRNHEAARRTAMVRALQDGFYLQDVSAGGEIIEINPAMTEILGLRAEDLPIRPPFPFWPTPDEDPSGASELATGYEESIQAGSGHLVAALRHVVTRRPVWVSVSYSSFTDLDGQRRLVAGTMRDVTAQHLATQRDEVLVEAGHLVGAGGDLTTRLTRLLELAGSVLGPLTGIALVGPDGLLRPAGTERGAGPEPADTVPESPDADLACPIPPELDQAALTGRAFISEDPDGLPRAVLLPHASPGTHRDVTHDRGGFGGEVVVAPLVSSGRLIGALTIAGPHHADRFDPADMAFVEELARRATVLIETDRLAAREHHLHHASAALAAAATVAQAAAALAQTAIAALDASGVAVFTMHPEGSSRLRLEHQIGLGDTFAARFSSIALAEHPLIAEVMISGAPVWLHSATGWQERSPGFINDADVGHTQAVASLPLRLGPRVIGALAITFSSPRSFPVEERRFAMTLVDQAAQAIERAALADTHASIADILQRSLLPTTLPTLPRLALATHYQPAGRYSQAGGDWYDVITLDADRVAIVVGDVVGSGALAAAAMGQLRSALAAYLLEDHGVAHAVSMLSAYTARVEGALGSTVVCLELDTATGDLRWVTAGHPPPLILAPEGPRYLSGGHGIVLGAGHLDSYREASTRLEPGSSVVLYTDGLVERRGEVIDHGLDRLTEATTDVLALGPTGLLEVALRGALPSDGPADDVAVVIARLLPGPLGLRLPASPEQLRTLRREIDVWAGASALTQDAALDLQLAVSEAATNAIEHAYPEDSGGDFGVRLEHRTGGEIRAEITDSGSWRPPPADPGYRGRGLAMINAIGRDVTVEPAETGTTVRFTLPGGMG